MIVPRQSETVHRLLDPPLHVDDPCVVGDQKLKKFLTSLVALQTVNGEALFAVMLEVGTA
jgi:hypothetical protein